MDSDVGGSFGGTDAMRALWTMHRHFQPQWLASSGVMAGLFGFGCGVTIVTVLSQLFATFGVGFGVRLGVAVGTIAGIAWGRRHIRSVQPTSASGLLVSLAAVLLLWPLWMSFQLDGAQLLPLESWNWPYWSEAVGAAFGFLTWTVPVALWTCMLGAYSASFFDEESRTTVTGWSAYAGTAVGLLVAAYGFAASWGVLLPALLVIAGISLWLVLTQRTEDRPSASAAHGSGRNNGLGSGALLALAGFQAHAAAELLAETAPATLPRWLGMFAVLFAGAAIGGAGWAWMRRQRGLESGPSLDVGWWLAAIAVGQLALAGGLIDVSLWLASQLTSSVALEFSRLMLMAALIGPVGIWLGWTSRLQILAAAVWASCGFLAAELAGAMGTDPLVALWCAAVIALAAGGVGMVQRRAPVTRWKPFAWGTISLALLALAVISGWEWPVARSEKLLFSTPALVASRSGWETELLPHLDDLRMVTARHGTEGRWTLWKTRGGELQLRCQGVPRGAITRRPDWSPQYAPDVAATVWPLVLVDHPARVLVLGAGSGASLQAALSFPIRELVCCEADNALLSLVRGDIARVSGFDPFTDDRCRHVRQPADWLTLPTNEQFDVIVSSPPSAAVPAAMASLTSDFYHRAARRLTPHGVFCQRLMAFDFGPLPLLTAVTTARTAFPEVACLEVGIGEFLLLAAHDRSALVRPDLPQRLELPHVVHVLSRCNWDWSWPLNLPAYDGAALAEAVTELSAAPQSTSDPWMGYFAARDLLRWAPKLQETATLLSQPRSTAAVYPLPQEGSPPQPLNSQASRKSRYLEWVGREAESPEILRRLAEVATQRQLVQQYPDVYWWEYRKELREQLQDHPRTGLKLVSHTASGDPSRWHAEDRRRKEYFERLGAALKADQPTAEGLQAIENLLDPYDPLLTLFAHQELAELYARAEADLAREAAHRLHVIYYAPAGDASVRNVIAAIDHLVAHQEAAASDAERFDQLNGLLQTLRQRWEARNTRPSKSAKVTLQEIERSLLSVERAIDAMEPLAETAGYSASEWQIRRTVLDRILVRPFRSYRDQLAQYSRDSERKTRELLQRATTIDSDAKEASASPPAVVN